jgi:hypothetical protein
VVGLAFSSPSSLPLLLLLLLPLLPLSLFLPLLWPLLLLDSSLGSTSPT